MWRGAKGSYGRLHSKICILHALRLPAKVQVYLKFTCDALSLLLWVKSRLRRHYFCVGGCCVQQALCLLAAHCAHLKGTRPEDGVLNLWLITRHLCQNENRLLPNLFSMTYPVWRGLISLVTRCQGRELRGTTWGRGQRNRFPCRYTLRYGSVRA